MTDPYERLDRETLERLVGELAAWALRQDDPSEPVVRFMDGTTLSANDLLRGVDFVPAPHGRMLFAEAVPSFEINDRADADRAWSHMLNLLALNILEGGETVDEVVEQLRSQHSRPSGGSAYT